MTEMDWIVGMTPTEWIDGALYPDTVPPGQLGSLGDQIDFLSRLCSSWDFGVLPEQATLDEIIKPEWRAAVEACRLLTSPTYHLLCDWHDLPMMPYLGQRLAYISEDPSLAHV